VGKGKHAGSRAGRLSAKQGRALVEQWRRSGQSVSEYCRAHDVREHVLRYRLSRETTRSQAAAAQSEFFVVSTPASAAAAAPANHGNRAGGAVIVMLPAVTPAELVQTVRGLLEGRA
jgi:predicted dinucleotide-binding enzyme